MNNVHIPSVVAVIAWGVFAVKVLQYTMEALNQSSGGNIGNIGSFPIPGITMTAGIVEGVSTGIGQATQ